MVRLFRCNLHSPHHQLFTHVLYNLDISCNFISITIDYLSLSLCFLSGINWHWKNLLGLWWVSLALLLLFLPGGNGLTVTVSLPLWGESHPVNLMFLEYWNSFTLYFHPVWSHMLFTVIIVLFLGLQAMFVTFWVFFP